MDVRRVVSLRSVVDATHDSTEHAQVIDAASDVFVPVFADGGRHAWLVVGVSSPPTNTALEIELVVQTTTTP